MARWASHYVTVRGDEDGQGLDDLSARFSALGIDPETLPATVTHL
jgi:hypothetical protein